MKRSIIVFLLLSAIACSNHEEEARQKAFKHLENAKVLLQEKKGSESLVEMKAYLKQWFIFEDGVKEKSKDSYRLAEETYGEIVYYIEKGRWNEALLGVESLDKLLREVDGANASNTQNSSTSAQLSIPELIIKAQSAKVLLDEGKDAEFLKTFSEIQEGWFNVEGQVAAQAPADYEAIESLLVIPRGIGNAEKQHRLDQLIALFKKHENPIEYSWIDSMMILLREGLEALLIVIMMVSLANRMGLNKNGIYIGVAASLLLSLFLGVAAFSILGSLMSGANREFVEALVGLVAAPVLFYVAMWLHSNSSMKQWTTYLKDKIESAEKQKREFVLGTMAFLAVFREGAETVLFYLGMIPSISTGNFLIGIGVAVGALIVSGLILFVFGLKLPLKPFFLFAGAFLLFLGFRFVGTGLNKLQIQGVIPTTPIHYMPDLSFVGLYPSIEVVGVQLVTLSIIISVLIIIRRKQRSKT